METQADMGRKTYKEKLQLAPEQVRALDKVLWRCRTLYHSANQEPVGP